MLSDLVAVVRSIARTLWANTSPGQLAAGFTIGMIIGVMPKSNLIALSLCMLMFSIRCNKGLGLVSANAFRFVSPLVDPFAHKVGLAVLGFGPLQSLYASVLNMPLGPWIGFNNTVVIGTLVTGLYVAYPVFWFTRLFFRGVQSVFGQKPKANSGHGIPQRLRAAA